MLVRKLRSLFGKAGDGDAGAATAAGGRAQASEQQAEAAPTLVLLDNAEALGTRFDQHLERFWEFRKGTVFAQGLRDKADTFLQANTPHPAEPYACMHMRRGDFLHSSYQVTSRCPSFVIPVNCGSCVVILLSISML